MNLILSMIEDAVVVRPLAFATLVLILVGIASAGILYSYHVEYKECRKRGGVPMREMTVWHTNTTCVDKKAIIK